MEKRFRKLDNYDPYYRTAVSGVAAQLHTLAMSDRFADEVGADEADELNDLADNIRLSYAVLSTRQEYVVLRPRAFKRIYEVPGYLAQTYTDKEGKTRTYLDALKMAAAEAGQQPEGRTPGAVRLYDDLYLLDSKVQMGLKLPPLPPEKAKHTRDRSWKNYALALADTQVYYRHQQTEEHDRHHKAIFAEDHTVIDTDAYTAKQVALLSDPAVKELAKKYMDPAARKALFPQAVPQKYEPQGVGSPPKPEDPRGQADYRPDIRSLRIGKLQEELAELRLDMQKEQGEASASL